MRGQLTYGDRMLDKLECLIVISQNKMQKNNMFLKEIYFVVIYLNAYFDSVEKVDEKIVKSLTVKLGVCVVV